MAPAETIFALASGGGRAGVAVLRISGQSAAWALTAITAHPPPPPQRASRRRLIDPADGKALDEALVLLFAAPRSYTGEDVVELHLHGGPAVIAGVSRALAALPGLRLARPGEFTRRAFENGRMDLVEAEGLADLIDAETEGQRLQALRQMRGALGALYRGWSARINAALALAEAEIDFPDEDLPEDLAQRVRPAVVALLADIEAHLDDAGRGERVRDGYRIAILGAPNAGKSSLLNALTRREAAIVSDLPGTTRDVLEARLVLAGFPVWLADTAGLREAADAIEAEGVRRALARADDSDLRLAVVDSSGEGIPPTLRAALKPGDILVLSKADLAPGEAMRGASDAAMTTAPVSTKTGAGLDALGGLLAERVGAALGGQEAPALTRQRHRDSVLAAANALKRALDPNNAPELIAEDLRMAARSLGKITGTYDVELILDQIFNDFCIGK